MSQIGVADDSPAERHARVCKTKSRYSQRFPAPAEKETPVKRAVTRRGRSGKGEEDVKDTPKQRTRSRDRPPQQQSNPTDGVEGQSTEKEEPQQPKKAVTRKRKAVEGHGEEPSAEQPLVKARTRGRPPKQQKPANVVADQPMKEEPLEPKKAVTRKRHARTPKEPATAVVVEDQPTVEKDAPPRQRKAVTRKRALERDEEEPPAEQRPAVPDPDAVAPRFAQVHGRCREVVWMLKEKLDKANRLNQNLMGEAEAAENMRERMARERLENEVKELQKQIEELNETNDVLKNKADAHDIYKGKYVQLMDVCREAQGKMADMERRRERFVALVFEAKSRIAQRDKANLKLQDEKKAIIERQRAFKKYTPIMFSIIDELAPLAVGIHHVIRRRIDNLASEGIRELLLSACREHRDEDDQMAAEVEKLISHGVKVPVQPKAEKTERKAGPSRAKSQAPRKKPNMNAPEETEKEIMSQLAGKLKKNEAVTVVEPVIAGGTKTIHGQKSVTVREQQQAQLQKMSVKEKAAMMKLQQERARREMSPRGQQLARDLSMTPSPVKSKESDSREEHGDFNNFNDDLYIDDGALMICEEGD